MRAVLRKNQQALKAGIREKWDSGSRCVAGVLATGGGKTVTMASLAADLDAPGIVQAHRSELVGQLSLAWAREGIRHDITASPGVRRQIIDNHLDKLGRSYYDPKGSWSVESVDTALRREPRKGVKYVFTDEGHHVLRSNKWGKAMAAYDSASWLLMTATPGRADGKGLGAHADGYVNAMVMGPGLAQCMAEGYLVTYDALVPTAADLDLQGLEVGVNGEFNQKEMAKRVKGSTRIVGDAVEHYVQHAWGKLAIVFAADIEHATTLLNAYKARGVPAELVTGEDLDAARMGAMKRFERRETLVLINVDLFGEGTDVPGVEVVQMCRPTASFPLFAQQIGRMLRLDIDPLLMQMWDTFDVATRLWYISQSRKPKALLIDHVGNMYRPFKIGDITYSGPPEGFDGWSLDGRGRTRASGTIPMRLCLSCTNPYERFYSTCPYCGAAAPEPDARGGPEKVDGSLAWYDPNRLAEIRANIARIDGDPVLPASLDGHARKGALNNWYERQRAQHALRETIAMWAGHSSKYSDEENYKRFYFLFGIDVPSAAALGQREAEALMLKIHKAMFHVEQTQ